MILPAILQTLTGTLVNFKNWGQVVSRQISYRHRAQIIFTNHGIRRLPPASIDNIPSRIRLNKCKTFFSTPSGFYDIDGVFVGYLLKLQHRFSSCMPPPPPAAHRIQIIHHKQTWIKSKHGNPEPVFASVQIERYEI